MPHSSKSEGKAQRAADKDSLARPAALNAYVLTDGNLKFKALLCRRTGRLERLGRSVRA